MEPTTSTAPDDRAPLGAGEQRQFEIDVERKAGKSGWVHWQSMADVVAPDVETACTRGMRAARKAHGSKDWPADLRVSDARLVGIASKEQIEGNRLQDRDTARTAPADASSDK